MSLFLLIQLTLLIGQNDFSFAYLSDLHLRTDSAVIESYERFTSKLNALQPDFVLTGGDMIYTAKNVDQNKASLLFDLMDEEFKLLKMPIYLTMGNHETVWGKRMYENRYTNRYYSLNYEGWIFFILDGIEILEKEKDFTLGVDSVQIHWIKDELSKTHKDSPIIVSIHTPLINPHAMRNSR